MSYTNWSGSVSFTPGEIARPRNTSQVARLVKKARARDSTLRPVGSGHSSMPIFVTDGTVVSLERMSGLMAADADAGWARVRPGTGLRDLGEQLAQYGLAMENLGDVDYQSIAGAVSTGTHGSGMTLGNLSSTVIGGTLVNGLGEEVAFGVDASQGEQHDLLRAAQVSLGALGIFTSLTLRVEEAHHLHRQNWITHIDWVLENYAELVESNRSMDFYWYPRSDLAQIRMLNKPGEEPVLTPEGQPHSRLKTETVGPNYQIIPNDRHLPFEEMEYMLPFDQELTAFRQVRERIKAKHRAQVGWRVLVRTIAPDQAMLSNAQGRPTMTIALLQNTTLPYQEYFEDIEPIYWEFGGRPHWGKKHRLTAYELARLYPDWDGFRRIRRQLDPDSIFMNDYLHELLGEES
ncbi:D-arabinono-1,4-lactone oxidase [Nesterenkonia muleiensis]|uniref:D-arabinono-1,4-lactone oxidase n=1 Tax=Nesterenkonia muleiensis TaxID=2282648 RepID=UPI00192E643C|nr:D-arabinono-1,4-lactone oxidase [Nesterenkonia muleiensis]